ncbi:MAG: hypothetical protein ACOYJQ_14255 [Pseudochelatococcus sp.]
MAKAPMEQASSAVSAAVGSARALFMMFPSGYIREAFLAKLSLYNHTINF